MHPDLPVLRDPDGYIYVKEEVGGLLMGGFEPVAKPWAMDGIPENFEFGMLPDDWDQFQILMENALIRLPALETAEIKTFMNGPESFTPDNNFIIGEAPELKNFFVAAGFNSIGIASGGGAGRALAEWIVQGEPTLDLWPVDIRRFARFYDNDRFLKDRVSEVLGLHYKMPWPNRELQSARPLRRSPLYDRLAAQNALFGSKMGWERPNFFAPSKDDARIDYAWERQNWFPHAAAEHKATREAVTIIDLTSFAKFLVQGRDAEAALQRLCANDVAVPVGQTVYTGLLNARGTYESDLTVARMRRTASCSSPAPRRRRATPTGSGAISGDANATLTDVTSAYAVIAVMGPRSRELLSRLTKAPLDNAAFPFGTIREIGIGYATVLASRRTYVGELGWELYVPVEYAVGVYDALMEAGRDLGARNAGYYAIESLRLEKGLSRVGPRADARLQSIRSGLELRGETRQGRFPRPRRAARREGQAARAPAAELRRDIAGYADRAWRRIDPAQWRAGRRSDLGRLRPHRWRNRGARLCRDRRREGR